MFHCEILRRIVYRKISFNIIYINLYHLKEPELSTKYKRKMSFVGRK